jgi:hypothetical protein
MAICPTKSILIDGLSYERDFFEIPEDFSLGNSFLTMIANRRAIRNFQDKPVPRELLEKIIQAISFAPPGFPPIKTEIVVVQDTALIRKALPYMIEVNDFLLKAMNNPVMRLFIRQRVGKETFNSIQNHVVPFMKSRFISTSGLASKITLISLHRWNPLAKGKCSNLIRMVCLTIA